MMTLFCPQLPSHVSVRSVRAPSRQGLSAQAILKHEPCLIDAAEVRHNADDLPHPC